MPALVVWERLIVAGDDLRLLSVLTLILRIVQVSMIIYVVTHIIRFEHKPELFVQTECLADEDTYWIWYTSTIAGCFFTLAYAVIGTFVEAAICNVSGRGAPTETDARELLVPLCKCNMLPMMVIRVAGFVFAMVALLYTKQYCNCVYSRIDEEGGVLELERAQIIVTLEEACPTSSRNWYICSRLLIVTMACDAFVPFITLIVVLRKRIYGCYRRIRPVRELSVEEVQRSYEMTCKRFCECSSLMTCYMFGGQNLTAGSYADVAIALTDFLADGGSLDIVPTDIAAALICLVNIQKQKQIDCKKELLEVGGIFAKDRGLATRLWRQFFHLDSTTNSAPKRQESMRGISLSLKKSLSLSLDSVNNSIDAESGLGADDRSMSLSLSDEDEEKEEVAENAAVCIKQTMSASSMRDPTDTELEQLRQNILTNQQSMRKIDFRLIHKNNLMSFEPNVSTLLSPKKSFDCLMLGEGSRYCAVALAAYSWMMYLWTNKCTGCCELTADSICSFCKCRPRCGCFHNDNIIGSDVCGWKQATVLKSLGIEKSDLLYANFQNGVGVNPYLILRDRAWKTIVLCIRGTLSMEDMISDVTLTPDSLERIGETFGFDGRGEYCHSGMLAGAIHIYEDLKRHKILDEAMEAHPDFGLRITGHSLGAGVAAMLGRLLRQQYPQLHCLCFSPPGCVFSERTARESKEYVCSFVLHNDIVPRLSYDALVNLRNDLIEIIARIKVPKHKIFDAHYSHWDEESMMDLPEKLLHDTSEIPPSKFFAEFEDFRLKQEERRQGINMTVPGRIMHFVRTSTKYDNVPCSCLVSCVKCIAFCGLRHETKKYKIKWTEPEDLSEIIISPTMMVDHFPYNVAHALDAAADSYGVADRATDMHERDQLERILETAKKDS